MMERVLAQTYLGNIKENKALAAKVAQAKAAERCFEVEIERSDRAKGRVLIYTAAGRAVGIAKARDWQLREGDILETAQGELVVVHLKAQQVMALRFEVAAQPKMTALVQLGYMLGNQHWPTTVAEDVVYVEGVADKAVMEKMVSEMAIALAISGLQISFESKPANAAVDFHKGHKEHTHKGDTHKEHRHLGHSH